MHIKQDTDSKENWKLSGKVQETDGTDVYAAHSLAIFCASGCVVRHKKYSKMNGMLKSKFTAFEILKYFLLPYTVCPRYPYIRVYQLYN